MPKHTRKDDLIHGQMTGNLTLLSRQCAHPSREPRQKPVRRHRQLTVPAVHISIPHRQARVKGYSQAKSKGRVVVDGCVAEGERVTVASRFPADSNQLVTLLPALRQAPGISAALITTRLNEIRVYTQFMGTVPSRAIAIRDHIPALSPVNDDELDGLSRASRRARPRVDWDIYQPTGTGKWYALLGQVNEETASDVDAIMGFAALSQLTQPIIRMSNLIDKPSWSVLGLLSHEEPEGLYALIQNATWQGSAQDICWRPACGGLSLLQAILDPARPI